MAVIGALRRARIELEPLQLVALIRASHPAPLLMCAKLREEDPLRYSHHLGIPRTRPAGSKEAFQGTRHLFEWLASGTTRSAPSMLAAVGPSALSQLASGGEHEARSRVNSHTTHGAPTSGEPWSTPALKVS